MKRLRVVILSVSVIALVSILAAAQTGPTRVRLDSADGGPQVWSIGYGGSTPLYPMRVVYGPPGYPTSAEIVSHVGAVLGAIDNSEDRNRLAKEWLQFSKQTIAKDQQLQQQWLQLQQQQLAQQQEAEQLRLQMAQLQMKIEELRAQNLRLEQQLAQGTNTQAPRTSLPTPSPQ